MKYAVNLPNFGYYHNPREIAQLAWEAENAGWDGFFLWDHLTFMRGVDVPFLDPFIALAAIAMKTEEIKIGTVITPIPRRRPWKLARETTSLDHLSDGRLILGVGIGNPDSEFTSFGEEVNPIIRAKKLDEGLEILIGLWSGKTFKFKGEHYQIKRIKFLPTPVNGHIPIWVAGMWPKKKPFIRAAKFDGSCPIHINWPNQLSPNEIKEILSFIKQHRTKTSSFDILIGGDTPGDPKKGSEILKPYVEAGVTWWSENINALRFNNSSEKMLERIRQGPPKK
ncbi:MAG: LLM class flavin-dependent oxidoreductase, partial [Candidatus Hermodarchaeota archaeon]